MQTATKPIESTEKPMMRSLETDGPYSELKDKLMLFGQFAGFGTMVRFYDPNIDAWHCVWVAPLSRVVQTFTARRVGDEIILEGKNAQGFLERWIFSEIKPDSFHWRAVESRDQGQTWHLDQRIWAVRISPENSSIAVADFERGFVMVWKPTIR